MSARHWMLGCVATAVNLLPSALGTVGLRSASIRLRFAIEQARTRYVMRETMVRMDKSLRADGFTEIAYGRWEKR